MVIAQNDNNRCEERALVEGGPLTIRLKTSTKLFHVPSKLAVHWPTTDIQLTED